VIRDWVDSKSKIKNQESRIKNHVVALAFGFRPVDDANRALEPGIAQDVPGHVVTAGRRKRATSVSWKVAS